MPIGDYPAHALEPHEALALFRTPNPRNRTGARDRAMIALMWRCGLRNSELRDLDLEHISEERVRVMRPKGYKRGKKPRDIGLNADTWGVVLEWLAFRGIAPGPLFTTRHGQRLDERQLRRMVARRARDAGLQRRVHPHCLRHTFARALYDKGVGMVHIQKALGHSNLATTAVYLEGIGANEVVEVTSAIAWEN